MTFADFKIGEYFVYSDQKWQITGIVHAIGVIEAMNDIGEKKLFDFLQFSRCQSLTTGVNNV